MVMTDVVILFAYNFFENFWIRGKGVARGGIDENPTLRHLFGRVVLTTQLQL